MGHIFGPAASTTSGPRDDRFELARQFFIGAERDSAPP
jgi:hypothetical protein